MIAGETCGGHQSTVPGVDLEFFNRGVRYIVSIKSGPNWGNTSQRRKLRKDLRAAVAQMKRSKRKVNIQPVLGLCYGKTKTTYLKGYLKIVGQNFWYMISEDKDLYTDIIDPIGHRACEHNEIFDQERGKAINWFTRTFIDRFCSDSGKIDWVKLIEFNSGNYDLDTILA